MSKFKAEVQRQQTKNKPASFFAQENGEGAGEEAHLEAPESPSSALVSRLRSLVLKGFTRYIQRGFIQS